MSSTATSRGRWFRALSRTLLCSVLALPVVFSSTARAQDKAVYWDAKYSTGWLQDNASKQLKDYFTSIGYQLVDAAGLKTFMQAHVTSKAPSVVVLARDSVPDTVVDVSSGSVVDTGNLIIDYMNNSGRVMFVGDWPFYNIGVAGGGNLTPAPQGTGATTILGIPGSDASGGCVNDDQKPVVITTEGKNEGLTTPWNSQRVLPDTNVDVVLAESAEGATADAGCAAGWIKKFPNAQGSGEFIRLYDRVIGSFNDADLTQIRSVGEFGFAKSADTVAPSAISDLAVTSPAANGVTLTFTAPADTGTGSSGNAAGYEIRYSTQPITAANVGSATRAGGPVPAKAGTKESIPITGLDPLQNYYFAIIAHDAAGNASALSNITTGQTGFVNFPTLPVVANADKGVYYDESYTTNWVSLTDAQQIRDYFVGKGYTLLSADDLATFMSSHATSKTPSAVVMAMDITPETVVDITGTLGNTNIVNNYMNNGGRVIQYGDWPFYNISKSDGTNFNPAAGGAEAILGFNASGGTGDIGDAASLTPTAVALGLKSSWNSVRPANPADVDVVLASSKGGAAGWIKFYPTSTGPGFFGRLFDNSTGTTPLTADQLADGQKLAEFSGTLNSNPARINGTVLDSSGSPAVNATVTITSAAAGSTPINAGTNALGQFSVLIGPGDYTLAGTGPTASGVLGKIAPSAPVNVALGQITTAPNLTLAPETLPSLTKPTDKAVYYDDTYTTSWAPDAVSQMIRDFFVGKGYTLIDAAGLATFMSSHITSKTPSVVVMSQDIYPDTVVDISTGAVVKKNVVTDYLNAGGRTINFGDIPFYNVGQAGTTNLTAADNGAQTVIGLNTASAGRDVNDTTVITPIGKALGLTSTWVSSRPADAGLVDVTLDSSQGGKAAGGWIKLYPDATGTGAFIRLIDSTINTNDPATDTHAVTPAELADAQILAEFGGAFPSTGGNVLKGDLNGDGKVNIADATMALQFAVGNGTPTAAQIAAGDVVGGDGKIGIPDVTKILQAAIGAIQL